MVQKGSLILYGVHGVCRIIDVEKLRFGKDRAEYYVLEPLNQPDSRCYVPVNNQAAVSKLRPLMTREELLRILHDDEVRNTPFIGDENQRKLRYRELIHSGDRPGLMGMISALHRHKKELAETGRKFHQCDENFLQDAEKLLNAEFSQVFGLDSREVKSFILRELENTH